MNKKVKLCLALFLALAVLAQYSFSPQALFAYGLENTAATQAEEQASDDNQDSDKQETLEMMYRNRFLPPYLVSVDGELMRSAVYEG